MKPQRPSRHCIARPRRGPLWPPLFPKIVGITSIIRVRAELILPRGDAHSGSPQVSREPLCSGNVARDAKVLPRRACASQPKITPVKILLQRIARRQAARRRQRRNSHRRRCLLIGRLGPGDLTGREQCASTRGRAKCRRCRPRQLRRGLPMDSPCRKRRSQSSSETRTSHDSVRVSVCAPPKRRGRGTFRLNVRYRCYIHPRP